MSDSREVMIDIPEHEDSESERQCHSPGLRYSRAVSFASSLSGIWQCHRDAFSKEAFTNIVRFFITIAVLIFCGFKLAPAEVEFSSVNVWLLLIQLVLAPWFPSDMLRSRND